MSTANPQHYSTSALATRLEHAGQGALLQPAKHPLQYAPLPSPADTHQLLADA